MSPLTPEPGARTDAPPVTDDERDPRVPVLRSWRSVYVFVLGCLAAYIALFSALGGYFSR